MRDPGAGERRGHRSGHRQHCRSGQDEKQYQPLIVKKAASPEHESGDSRGMILPERRAGRAVRGAGRNQAVVRHLEYENRGVTVIGELARVSADCGTIPGWLNGF
ncbi:hypothetical protein LBMAG57_22480 [Verrucomicrobiota bacterium]|nr:hypothetical protein LBMAG57_22480 [Verrucomicrobiota bacterium]